MAAAAGGEVEEPAARSEAADADMNTDNGKPQDVSTIKKTSFVALLEEANTIRKEKLNDSANVSNEMNDTSVLMPGDDANGAIEAGNTSPVSDAAESKVGRSAYSAETVAAISSLASGQSPLFYDDINGSSGGGTNTVRQKSASSSVKKAALAKKEISLQDRASAVMLVYKDYLDETKDKDDSVGQSENGAEMVTDNDALLVPFHTVKHRPLNLHERRKEGHKVAVLDKFCKDVEEGNISATNENYFDDSDDDNDGGSQQGSRNS